MGTFITDLKQKFKQGNIYIQLIYINVAIFLATSLLTGLMRLFNRNSDVLLSCLELPASLTTFLTQPWSILSYMFMHAGLLHILFNMLWLYWFGALFLSFFSAKHLRGLYILGGIFGGLFYMVAYNFFPLFEESVHTAMLLGASASVIAIVVATAYREPNYPVRLLLIGTIRLKYIALFMILSDMLFMTNENAGGHIAHLGGAAAGFLFAAGIAKGVDVTSWINRFLDLLSSPFDGSWKRRKKPTMKVHYNRNPKDFDYNAKKKEESEKVDRILEKIKKSGYQNLTTEEKKSLFDASKR